MCKILKNNLKILKTIDIYMSMFTVGLTVSLTGPALLDLQKIVGTDMQHIALIYTSRSIGYLVGAVLGGIVFDIVSSKLAVFTVCNFFMAVTMFGIPWSRHVNTLLGFAVVNGLSLGALETGANVFCIGLWGSGPFFQALQFIFGVGGLISPVIAAPFLENQNNSESNTTHFSNCSTESSLNFYNETPSTTFEGVASITYPFSIVGGVASLSTALFLITWLVAPKDDKVSQTDKNSNSDRSCPFMFFTVIFTFLIFFVCTGTEIGFAQTLTTYAVKGRLHTNIKLGSYMTSAFWTSFTVMRLVSVFLSIKVSNMILIISDMILIAISGVLLLFFMTNEWAVWAAAIAYGMGVASSYPSLVGWLDEHIEITNKISSIFLVGCAIGEMFVPFIITYFMEILPDMLAYVTAASSVITTVLFLMLYGLVRNDRKDDITKKTECKDTKDVKV